MLRSGDSAFADLYFGEASAEKEVSLDPARFRQTYLDRWRLRSQIANHGKFVILGPKGTGKSAAARYIELSWKHDTGEHAVFPIRLDFDELNRTQTPLTDLDSKNVSPDLNAPSASAWKLFIGIRLLESLMNDPQSTLYGDTKAAKLVGQLKDAGLASDDYPEVLRTVRTRRAGFSLRGFLSGEYEKADSDTLSIGQVADAVIGAVINARSTNRHLMTIDGLDKGITLKNSYWRTLAALIRVGADFTARALESNASHVFVVVMCRSDVFRKISFSDAAKVAEDWGIHISWHAEAARAKDVLLWEYLARKAGIDRDRLFGYLPTHVQVGAGGIPAERFLLEVTRYTPRDMSALFRRLQEESPKPAGVAPINARSAGERFAREFLLTEIQSEATGLLHPDVVSKIEAFLASIPARRITKGQFVDGMRESGIDTLITQAELGEYLFLQGAIANLNEEAGYVQSYHRRDATDFRVNGPWVLHTGLLYAFNIPWTEYSSRQGRSASNSRGNYS